MVDPRVASRRFSAMDVAFAGFRLIRSQPGVVAVWGALYLAFSVLLGGGMVLTVGPTMTALAAQRQLGAVPDPTASFAMMGRVLPFEGLALIAALLFYALLFAAANRALLRTGTGGPGRLALGGDEWRQVLLLVILGVLFFIVYIVLVIVAVIVGVVLGMAVAGGAHMTPGAPPPGPVIAVMLVMSLAVLVTLGVLFTRLSLASPLTFDTARIDVFGSWRLTRGIFWPLFGAYVVTWLLAVLLFVVALIVFSAVAAATGGGLGAAGIVLRPDMSSLGSYFAPMMLLWIVIVTAVGTVAMAMLLAAPIGAYAQLKTLGLIPADLARGGGATPGGPAAPASDLPRFGH